MLRKHCDEAKTDSIEAIEDLINQESSIERVVLIDDLFGRLRVAAWIRDKPDAMRVMIDERLKSVADPYWTNEIWLASDTSTGEYRLAELAWKTGRQISDRFKVADRHRRLGAWLADLQSPAWTAHIEDENADPRDQTSATPVEHKGPPIVVFHSFKGGMGRSTVLASFAVRRARRGERVVVVDMDLDAPGIATLLASDDKGTIAQWGIVDYFIERPFVQLDLADYYHACRSETVTGSGEILVFPAGTLNNDYLGKLARIDFEPTGDGLNDHPLRTLLEEVRNKLEPNWILIDSRTGISEPAGLLLGGIAHLHLLIGNSSEQSWRGLRLVLERLGADRVRQSLPQLECILAHAMVPEDTKAARAAIEEFSERARDEFASHYYAYTSEETEELGIWDVSDLEGSDAPHVSIPLYYKPKFSHFDGLEDIADSLASDADFGAIERRILERFGVFEERENG